MLPQTLWETELCFERSCHRLQWVLFREVSPLDRDELSGVVFQVPLGPKENNSGQEILGDVPSPPLFRACLPVVPSTLL